MKKYLSVFAMLARGSFFRILLLLCLMAAGQCGRFLHRLQNELTLYESRVQQFAGEAAELTRLESLINVSTVSGTFAAAFLLICIVLCLPGCGWGANCGYTLRRLRISERAVFVIQALYNAMVFVILWAAEVLICLFLCRAYVNAADPSLVSHQTVGLAFYRNDFLHSLLPMADITVWIRNIIMLAVLSLAAASFPSNQRRGKFAADIVSYALLSVIFFTRSVGDGFNTFITVFFGLCIAAEVIWKVFANEEEGEEDTPHEENQYPYAN
ncbi:MAG: hypothetical protein IJ302_08670 [Clostridia bacterium]|nr:hypothetical protein [Clostridia bacterium]